MKPALAVIEEIVRWIGPVFGVAGYPIIGTAVLLERSIFIGLVMPGDVLLALGAGPEAVVGRMADFAG